MQRPDQQTAQEYSGYPGIYSHSMLAKGNPADRIKVGLRRAPSQPLWR